MFIIKFVLIGIFIYFIFFLLRLVLTVKQTKKNMDSKCGKRPGKEKDISKVAKIVDEKRLDDDE